MRKRERERVKSDLAHNKFTRACKYWAPILAWREEEQKYNNNYGKYFKSNNRRFFPLLLHPAPDHN